MAISPQLIIRSTSCLVLGWAFWGLGIEWRYFRLYQIQDGGRPCNDFLMLRRVSSCLRYYFTCVGVDWSFYIRVFRVHFRYEMTTSLLHCRCLRSQGPHVIRTRVTSLSAGLEEWVWSWPSGWWNAEQST